MSELGNQIAQRANELLGTPFKEGGRDRSGVDCIGLPILVANELGVLPAEVKDRLKSPHATKHALNLDLFKYLRRNFEQVSDKQPGDFLLYRVPGVKFPTHLAVVVENDMIVHSHSIAKKVVKTNMPNKNEGCNLIGIFRVRGLQAVSTANGGVT